VKYRSHVCTAALRLSAAFIFILFLMLSLAPARVHAAAPVISGSPPAGQVGTAYTYSFSATCDGGSCSSPTWSISGLPLASWIGKDHRRDPYCCRLVPIDVTVTDPVNGTSTASFIIMIGMPPITFTTTSIPNATVGRAYSASVVASGAQAPLSIP